MTNERRGGSFSVRDVLSGASTTAFGSVATMALGALRMKLLASLGGPAVVGLQGLLDQATTTAASIATMGSGTAIVQGISVREGGDQDKYLRTACFVLGPWAVVTALSLALAGPVLPGLLFGWGRQGYGTLVSWLAFPVIGMAASSFLTAVLNAHRDLKAMALISVLGGMVAAALAAPAVRFYKAGFPEALVAAAGVTAMVGVVAAGVHAAKRGWLKGLARISAGGLDSTSARDLIRISTASIAAGLAGNACLVGVRAAVAQGGGSHDLGMFEASWRVSMSYVTLVLSSLGTYYLPSLTSAKETDKANLMQTVFGLSVAAFLPIVTAMVALKPLVLTLLYSPEFLPAAISMRWMLIGDYVKVSTWVLAMPVLARADMKVFFVTETLFNLGLLGAALVPVPGVGRGEAVGIAFLVLYGLLMVFYGWYSRKKIGLRLRKDILVLWLVGLFVVAGVSATEWRRAGDVQWTTSALWILAALACSALLVARVRKPRGGGEVRSAQ